MRTMTKIAGLGVVALGATVLTALDASAAAGCRVSYAVTNSWQGGFGASVAVTNLGDPVNGWTLGWTFPSGQTVTRVSPAGEATGIHVTWTLWPSST